MKRDDPKRLAASERRDRARVRFDILRRGIGQTLSDTWSDSLPF